MTTPVTPQPVTQAAPEVSAREFFNQDDDALGQVLGLAPEVAETETEEVELQDEAPLPGAEKPETVPTDSEGPEAKEQPTEVELPPVQRKLMTDFKIFDDKGELEVPDVKIKFKAKGEERELPLDHVVRLAQFGFANEEREQQVIAAKQFVAEAQQKEEVFQQTVQQYEQYYDRIFNDPAFYEEARLAYLQQHTPEARAIRAEQQLQRVEQDKKAQQEQQYLAGFTNQTLVPLMSRLMQENPSVSETEVVGKFTTLTAPLLKNGRIPLNRLTEVQNLVQNDLANWVQQTHYERDLKKRQSDHQAAQATQKVVAAKRQAARVFATPGAVPDAQQKPTKFDSARDWLNATLPSQSE